MSYVQPEIVPGQPSLKGRTMLITGASRGIGRAAAMAFAHQGMRILATGRDLERLESLEAEAGDTPGTLTTFPANLEEPAAIDRLFEHARTLWPQLDFLVNNAGMGVFGASDEVSMDEWDQVLAVNARGAFRCSQHAFRWMKQNDGGRIVNIASVVGLRGYVNQAVYAASKHAMLGFTKVMAREGQAFGIRVAAICPGGVATELVRSARPDLNPEELIQPEDVVRAIHYLVTESTTCCTDLISLRRAGSTPFA